MTGSVTPGEDVALFIDWENFKISLATGRRHPNVSALKEEVSNLGRVVVAKAYADWVTRAPELRGASQFINDPPALYAAGIEPVYVPTRLSWVGANPEIVRHTRVKNSVDVKMTADCIECAHSYPNIGTFVLVSGDSDFIHVMNTLRTMGKRVVIIGVSWATSRRLVDQSDGLILYDVDVDPVLPAEPATEPAPAGNGRASASLPSPAPVPANSGATNSGRLGRPELADVIKEIEEIVRSERAAGGTPLLTSIKQRVMRRFPNFDEKQLGFSGFKKLMARAAQEGNIKLVTAGLVDWATMADEDVPADGQVPATEPEATTEEPAEVSESKPRRRFPSFRFGPRRSKNSKPGSTEPTSDEQDSQLQIASTDSVKDSVTDSVAVTQEDTPAETQQSEHTSIQVGDDANGEPESGPEAAAPKPTFSRPAWSPPGRTSEPRPSAWQPSAEPISESTLDENSPEFTTEKTPEAKPDTEASESVLPMSAELESILADSIAELNLPEGPGDGQDPKRISDLIIMADTLEHREGISHVAFNFLVGEVCQALEEGLKAEYGEITERWSSVYSRGYVSKLFRELSSGSVFTRGWHSWRDETSGHNRRRRTFNLDRNHPIVVQVLKDQWALGDGGENNSNSDEESGDGNVGTSADLDSRFAEDAQAVLDSTDSTETDGVDEDPADSGFVSRLFNPKS